MTSSARVIGHVDLKTINQESESRQDVIHGDFLDEMAGQPWSSDQLRQELNRTLAEIDELQKQNRWEDILSLFYPFDEQIPLLLDNGMADEVILKVSFALGRAGKHEEAIEALQSLCERDPENELVHYNLAYTVMDLLFSVRTTRRPLPPKRKAELIALAHHHFGRARKLRPTSVTFPYREAMLLKEIEGKSYKAIPLFEQAIANWKRLSGEERQRQHQQRPKYVKSLYHLASCLLEKNRPSRALALLEEVMEEDVDSNFMHPLFKHYALAKVLHALGRCREALDHLEMADIRADKEQQRDFVWELAARCHLSLQNPQKAAECIGRIPVFQRRPYIRWTEADVLLANGMWKKALQVLQQSAQRDRRSKHKALLRMAWIRLRHGQADEALELCRQANAFCQQTFGNESHEILYWQAACLYRLGRHREGLDIMDILARYRFVYPNLEKLRNALEEGLKGGSDADKQKEPKMALIEQQDPDRHK